MDSVPAPVERQDIGAPEPQSPRLVWLVGLVTTLAGVVLASFIVLMVWLQFSGSRVDAVEEPERAGGMGGVVERRPSGRALPSSQGVSRLVLVEAGEEAAPSPAHGAQRHHRIGR